MIPTIFVRIKGTNDVLLASLCTVQFDVLELTQRLTFQVAMKPVYLLFKLFFLWSAGKKFFGKKNNSILHNYQIVLLIYTLLERKVFVDII